MSMFQNFHETNYLYDNNDKINFYQNRLVITNDLNRQDKIINGHNNPVISTIGRVDDIYAPADYDIDPFHGDDMINDNTTTTTTSTTAAVNLNTNQANMVHLTAKPLKSIESTLEQCRICSETSTTGLHYGVVTCEACKKFFLRNTNTANEQLKCVRGTANCMVTKVTRTNCPYCRLKKCLSLGMNVNNTTQNQQIKILQCLVCSSPSSGIHFGVVTCEGCKGFFRRTIAQKSKLQCHGDGNCEIGSFTRNNCRSCRLNRCVLVGMSLTNFKIGRQSNLFKTKLFNNNKIDNDDYENKLHDANRYNAEIPSELKNSFDPAIKNIIETITGSYQKNMEESQSVEISMNYSMDQCVLHIIDCLQNHAVRCVHFMSDIELFRGLNIRDQINLLSNSIHSLRHLWIHKQNKHINYLHCDEVSGNCVGEVFTVFNSSNRQLKNLHNNIVKEINMDNREYALYTGLIILAGAYQSNLFDSDSISRIKFIISNVLSKYMHARRNEHESYHTLMSLIVNYTSLNMDIQRLLHDECLILQVRQPLTPLFKNVYLRYGLANNFSLKI